MNLKQTVVVSLLLLLCAGIGFAQTGEAASAPALTFPTMLNVPLAPCLPFTASVLSEYTRIQKDDSRVVTQAQDKVFRDAVGRTRAEFQVPIVAGGQPVENVVIMDPTLQLLIELDPQHRMATVRRSSNITAEATCAARILAVVQSTQPTLDENPTQTFPDGSTLTTESLGTKDIEGFTVPGVRHTLTRPTGAITVSEDWYSSELQMELVKSLVDAQSQRSLTVQNIQIVEPEEGLFQIPPDYTVRDIRQQD